MTTKASLLSALAAGREREKQLVALVDDSPAQPGRWTAKDNLAHLAAWRDYAARVVEAASSGSAPPARAQEDDDENEKIHARTKDLPAATVTAEATAAWDRLSAAVEACSEEQLHSPRPGNPELKTWEVVPGNGHGHLASHLVTVLLEAGDQAGAEGVARWAFEEETKHFSDDVNRGNATYNLGCFYSLQGDAERAIPLFKEAIGLRPDLREWAHKDNDLDPIRSRPEMAELLGPTPGT